jgi:DNA phosphorothioation-associated putative methyltransferase
MTKARRRKRSCASADPSRWRTHRERTAIRRRSLSSPMQSLRQYGYLSGRHSVFDFGCGRGDDVRILRGKGVRAEGWDPYFAPAEGCWPADVVNMGFVVNVIEDPAERRHALRLAFEMAERVLAVAALLKSGTRHERARLYRDGVVTSRDTFQKLYSHAELGEYVERTLGRDAVPVGRGVFFVFRDDEEQKRFLGGRTTARRAA